jgi:hypothetical protein
MVLQPLQQVAARARVDAGVLRVGVEGLLGEERMKSSMTVSARGGARSRGLGKALMTGSPASEKQAAIWLKPRLP